MQVPALKDPAPLLLHDTVAVGVLAVPVSVSDTVAVHVLAWLTATVEGEQLTTVDVDRLWIPSAKVPLLPLWVASPPYVPVIVAVPPWNCDW